MKNSEIIEKLESDLAEAIVRREWNAKIVKNGDKDRIGGWGNYRGEAVKADKAVAYYDADATCLSRAIGALHTMNYQTR